MQGEMLIAKLNRKNTDQTPQSRPASHGYRGKKENINLKHNWLKTWIEPLPSKGLVYLRFAPVEPIFVRDGLLEVL